MKIDWGASFFFSLMILFYGMAWFKPAPTRQFQPTQRTAAAIEYHPNTDAFPNWVPGERPDTSVAQ